MNMEVVLAERIEALESIIEHLQGNGQSRREHYQEKCAIYRHLRDNLVKDRQHPDENPSH